MLHGVKLCQIATWLNKPIQLNKIFLTTLGGLHKSFKFHALWMLDMACVIIFVFG